MRSEGYSSCLVCVCVCMYVCPHTLFWQYARLKVCITKDTIVLIFLKLFYSKVRAFFTYLGRAAIFSSCLLRVQCFVYSPLHVCLRVKHCVFNYYSRFAHVLNVERFCIRYIIDKRYSYIIIIQNELHRFE